MNIESIAASSLRIPFKAAFRHAAAVRATTQTLLVRARSRHGMTGFGEGCPREYVTKESLPSARSFVATHCAEWRTMICDLPTLMNWVHGHCMEIDTHPAAWTAVELALLDLIGRSQEETVESLLGLPVLAGRFRYTAVLGDSPPEEFEAQLGAYLRAGFRDFKIKLASDRGRDREKVKALIAASIPPEAVRADANNHWQDADSAIAHIKALGFPFFALEEPVQAGDYAGMRRTGLALNARIILDESVLRATQLDQLRADPERWIVNVRVSKMGGLLRTLGLAGEARRCGLPMIVGSHVGETSLLTRAALTIANSIRDSIVAQEGAFSTHLLARDIVEPQLMFARGGVLDTTALRLGEAPGFGLEIHGVRQIPWRGTMGRTDFQPAIQT